MSKKETAKFIVQLIASIATAILTALGATSCVGASRKANPQPSGWGFFCCLEIEALLEGFDLRLGGFDAALVVGGFLEAWILHLGVELNLGLGA